ncbi:SUMO ligase siz1 [Ceratobasidium sp. 394]|nr:SUMO ligase siz1 [Ceratobasidium sp. 394]
MMIGSSNDAIIRNLRRLPREHAKQTIIRLALADADVELGSHIVSLRCPITQTRINTPCRSSKCAHFQCFDAKNWLLFTEKMTDKKCPVCDTGISKRNLIVDEYFGDVLQQIPTTINEVVLEANGEWHTRDGRYRSSGGSAPGTHFTSQYPISGAAAPIRASSRNPAFEIPPPPPYAYKPSGRESPFYNLTRWVNGLQRNSGQQTHREPGHGASSTRSSALPLNQSSGYQAWLAGIYSLLLFLGLIEGSITAWLCVMLNLHHDYLNRTLGDRARLVCTTTWWTLFFLMFIMHYCLQRRRKFLVALYSFTWILWIAAAASISQLLYAQKICTLGYFPHCSKLKAIEGFAWILWILFTIGGVSLVVGDWLHA